MTPSHRLFTPDDVAAAVREAVAVERERCAMIAEAAAREPTRYIHPDSARAVAAEICHAIRGQFVGDSVQGLRLLRLS